jgi:hypothetical protein
MLCPMFIYSSVIYSEENTHIFNPDMAVALGKGTAGTSAIGINRTSANVTTNSFDFVDNNASNIDSIPDIGTHSNFTAQQTGPDLISDRLYETDTKGYTLNDWVDSNTSNVDGHTGYGTSRNFTAEKYTDTLNDTLTEVATSGRNEAWVSPNNFQDPANVWSTETNAYDENTGTGSSCSVAAFSWSDYLVLNLTGSTTGSKLEYYVGRSGARINNMRIDVANETGTWVNIFIGAPSVSSWTNVTGFTHTITAMRFSFYNRNPSQAGIAYVYEADYLSNSIPFNFELDYEFQWTSANYTSDNEQLCIRTGPLNSETIGVNVWNGTNWTNLITSLSPNSWNNVSLASYLTNNTITFCYKGGTESGDTAQSTWQIESALLHTWNNSNFEIDLEEQWGNVNYNGANDFLCIYLRSHVGSEPIRVDVWYNSAWQNLLTDLSVGWNNATVSSFLAGSTFTIRFKGSIETGDSTQDSWNIDATILDCWSNNYDYILSATSQKTYDQNITLTLNNYSNINRLNNCTVWFHDGVQSVQIKIINGVVTQNSGQNYLLAASSSRYIAVYVEQNSVGTSTLYLRLEAKTQNSIVYTCSIELRVT